MACINPDGSVSPSAKLLLGVLQTPHTVEDISSSVEQPLFKVRSSLRELTEAGFVEQNGEKYSITDAGREKL